MTSKEKKPQDPEETAEAIEPEVLEPEVLEPEVLDPEEDAPADEEIKLSPMEELQEILKKKDAENALLL